MPKNQMSFELEKKDDDMLLAFNIPSIDKKNIHVIMEGIIDQYDYHTYALVKGHVGYKENKEIDRNDFIYPTTFLFKKKNEYIWILNRTTYIKVDNVLYENVTFRINKKDIKKEINSALDVCMRMGFGMIPVELTSNEIYKEFVKKFVEKINNDIIIISEEDSDFVQLYSKSKNPVFVIKYGSPNIFSSESIPFIMRDGNSSSFLEINKENIKLIKEKYKKFKIDEKIFDFENILNEDKEIRSASIRFIFSKIEEIMNKNDNFIKDMSREFAENYKFLSNETKKENIEKYEECLKSTYIVWDFIKIYFLGKENKKINEKIEQMEHLDIMVESMKSEISNNDISDLNF